MDVYQTEDEQVEAIKKWLQENGKSVLFGVILGLVAIFGWRNWQSTNIEQAELASELYQSALVAINLDIKQDAQDKAMQILNNHENTGYAVFARLILSYIDTENSDYDSAEENLKLALLQTDNESLKHEINLRLVRIYIANNKLDQAMSLIILKQSDNFNSQYNELKGDIYVLQGNNEEARAAYQLAITESQSSPFDPSLLTIKLDSLVDQ